MKILIKANGAMKSLYCDGHPLQPIATMINRATNLVWNSLDKKWYIYTPEGDMLCDEGFMNRSDAIKAEIKILENRLGKSL